MLRNWDIGDKKLAQVAGMRRREISAKWTELDHQRVYGGVHCPTMMNARATDHLNVVRQIVAVTMFEKNDNRCPPLKQYEERHTIEKDFHTTSRTRVLVCNYSFACHSDA